MKRNTKLTGDISELKVLTALVCAGYRVCVPYGENCRYDLAAERGGHFFRVQVKSGRLRSGAVEFNCFSSHVHRGGASVRRYVGEVDYFGVYCATVDLVLWVPIATIGFGARPSFRLEPAKNGQRKNIRWASDYLLRSEDTPPVGTGLANGVTASRL